MPWDGEVANVSKLLSAVGGVSDTEQELAFETDSPEPKLAPVLPQNLLFFQVLDVRAGGSIVPTGAKKVQANE